MKKTIAICTNIPIFWNNKILNTEHCAKYFGASWMPLFSHLAIQNNYHVVSGDVALLKIAKNEINPKDVYVIQELNARHGKKLLKLGANGLLLSGGESPLFSYYFYDHLKSISDKFYFRKLFGGSYALMNQAVNEKNQKMYFPSYFLNENSYNNTWEKRKKMVMIAANKSGLFAIPRGIKEKFIWVVHRVYKLFSPSFHLAQKNELHSKRLEMVQYFGSNDKLSLFGSNWDDATRFEPTKREEMIQIINKLQPSFVDDKILTLSQYKYAICFENISFDGYVTEKIIHCFLAGTIPIYLGAPNITDFIPKNCFIDLRDFRSLEELNLFLEKLSQAEIHQYIANGKNFLASEEGKRFSYEYYAQDIMDKVLEFDDNNQ